MSRSSRVLVVAGLSALVPAAAGVGTLLWGMSVGVANAAVEPYLLAWVSAGQLLIVLTVAPPAVMVLVSAALMVARRPAGRSALVWLCSTGTVMVLMIVPTYQRLLHPPGYLDVWLGPAQWIAPVAVAVTVVALTVTAICLGLPAARFTRPLPPALPHRRAVWFLAAGGVLSVGVCIPAVALDSFVRADTRALLATGFIVAVMLAGTAGATVAGAYARTGRLTAVYLTRAGGAVLLAGQWMAAAQTPETTLISFGRFAGATDVPAVAGVALYVLGVLATAATVTGLTTLADPRTYAHFGRTQSDTAGFADFGATAGERETPAAERESPVGERDSPAGERESTALAPEPEPLPASGWKAP